MADSERDTAMAAALASQLAGRFAVSHKVVYSGLASTILLAADRNTRLLAALKVGEKRRFDTPEELSRALAEAVIHNALPPHVNVVPLLAAEDTASAILIATPFTPTGDLWELIKYGQTYCEAEVRHCAAQMMSGLHHVHAVCGLTHNDIKPHNFLLCRVDGRFVVQLCDFGLAEKPDAAGGMITFRGLRGTSGWFAPELLANQDYNCAVDLFSAGLIVFRMLAGYAAFDPPSCFREAAHCDPRYWCHVSPGCQQLVLQLLAVDPAARGSAELACRHAWFQGAAPPQPAPELIAALCEYGPPPITDVLFWPPDQLPPRESCAAFAEEGML